VTSESTRDCSPPPRSPLTSKELEALVGHEFKVGTKMVFVLVGERLFHREDGGWQEYE
jgi:hypothetical protein